MTPSEALQGPLRLADYSPGVGQPGESSRLLQALTEAHQETRTRDTSATEARHLMYRLVLEARQAGVTWERIGRALGTDRGRAKKIGNQAERALSRVESPGTGLRATADSDEASDV